MKRGDRRYRHQDTMHRDHIRARAFLAYVREQPDVLFSRIDYRRARVRVTRRHPKGGRVKEAYLFCQLRGRYVTLEPLRGA